MGVCARESFWVASDGVDQLAGHVYNVRALEVVFVRLRILGMAWNAMIPRRDDQLHSNSLIDLDFFIIKLASLGCWH